MKKGNKKLLASTLLFVTLAICVTANSAAAATAPLPVTGAAGIGMDNPTLQAQIAEM